MPKQARIIIFGRVQGVFFRHSAQIIARKLSLTGWVRNAEGGSVEAVVQGGKNDIEKFIEWCRKGPALARVERVETTWEGSSATYDSFEIK